MFRPNRMSVTAGIAVAALVAGGSYLFSGAAGQPGAVLHAAVTIADPAQPPAITREVPTAREILGPAAAVPLATAQPSAKIVVDPPLPEPLTRGVAVFQFRTENLRVLPVFGPAAVAVSPRIGHLHLTVDDSAWQWAHVSGEELIVAGLPAGPHKILIEVVDANHKILTKEVVKFEVPRQSHVQTEVKAVENRPEQHSPAKIVVEPPLPGPLARGVVFVQYRTENLQIKPVFGPAAVAVTPRLGHLHVSVDDVPWHWVDATDGPVIVAGLPRGPHKILIEVADANHKPLAQEVVKFEVP